MAVENLSPSQMDASNNASIYNAPTEVPFLFYTFFFSLVSPWTFVLNLFFEVPITTLICAQNVRTMFTLIFAGLFILKQCITYMTSFSSTPLWSNLEAHVTRRQWAVFFFIPTAWYKSGNILFNQFIPTGIL